MHLLGTAFFTHEFHSTLKSELMLQSSAHIFKLTDGNPKDFTMLQKMIFSSFELSIHQ